MRFLTRIEPQSGWAAVVAAARAECELLTPGAAAALRRSDAPRDLVLGVRAEDVFAARRGPAL